jgi:hypothetical protein
MSPPKKATGVFSARRKPSPEFLQLTALFQYQIAAFIARMFERPFWYWEQKRSQLWDELGRRGFKP